MIIKTYDILVNLILLYIAKGLAVDKPGAEEIVAFFLIHNAITLYLTAVDGSNVAGFFKFKKENSLPAYVIYHVLKYFVICLLLVLV